MTSKLTTIEVKDVTLASIALRELVERSEQSGSNQVSIDDETRKKVKNLAQLPFSQAVERGRLRKRKIKHAKCALRRERSLQRLC